MTAENRAEAVAQLALYAQRLDAAEWGSKIDGEFLPRWADLDPAVQETYANDADRFLAAAELLGYRLEGVTP